MVKFKIAWEEPPPDAFSNRSRGSWWQALEPLVERHGEWARVADGYASRSSVSGTLSNLRNRKTSYPVGDWEFKGTDSAIYARYLGIGSADK